jgi:hypothetical protein
MTGRTRARLWVLTLVLGSGCQEQRGGSDDAPEPEGLDAPEPEPEECEELCDPVEHDCPAGEGCLPNADRFSCQGLRQDGVRLGLHESCEPTSQNCDPGLLCLPVLVPGCTGPGCCVSFCDVNRPDCSESTSCVRYFEESATCHQEVGVCVIGA